MSCWKQMLYKILTVEKYSNINFFLKLRRAVNYLSFLIKMIICNLLDISKIKITGKVQTIAA